MPDEQPRQAAARPERIQERRVALQRLAVFDQEVFRTAGQRDQVDAVAACHWAGGHRAGGVQRGDGHPSHLGERPGLKPGRAVRRAIVAASHEAPLADALGGAKGGVGVVQIGQPERVAGLVRDRADRHDLSTGAR